MQHIRVWIEPVRPNDGSGFFVDPRLTEIRRVAERRAKWTPEIVREVNFGYDSIIEGQT
jgi:hypothetical protein